MRDESGSNHGGRLAAIASTIGARVAGLMICAGALAGCEAGTGGAVELSWKLRPNSSSIDARFVDCKRGGDEATARGEVAWMRLDWIVTDQDGVPHQGHDEWHCDDNHGVTGFALEPGTASLTLTPECIGRHPADPRAYVAPAPVIRTVARGDTISLGAVELVIAVAACGGEEAPCICPMMQ